MEERSARVRPLVARSGLAGWSLVIIWTLIILVLSLQPGTEELGRQRLRFDVSSAGHAAFFAILAFLIGSVIARYRVRRPAWWTIVIVALFGVVSELLQTTAPLRTASIVDLLADIVGAAVGSAIFVVGDRWTGGERLATALRALAPQLPQHEPDGSWDTAMAGRDR